MRFNSILGAFLFILLASFIALMTFVHTSSFGRVLTKVITDISERKAQTKVSIKSVGLSVFPPGIELHRVQIKKVFGPEESLNAEVGRLGFYLSLIEVEEKKLAFGEIRIQDSVVNYQHPKKDEPELKELDPKIIDMIFGLPDRSPIRIDILLVENLKLRINHD